MKLPDDMITDKLRLTVDANVAGELYLNCNGQELVHILAGLVKTSSEQFGIKADEMLALILFTLEGGGPDACSCD